MSPEKGRHEITTKQVVLRASGTDAVRVRHDIPYAVIDGERLTMDIYDPADSDTQARRAAVILVTGYPDEGLRRALGCNAKDMASYISWARLFAASGLVAITYVNRQPANAHVLLRYVRAHAIPLGIDPERLAIWACSGNVPTALSVLMETPRIGCAALLYGYMLDLDGSTDVKEASTAFHFANPTAGRAVGDLPADTPLLVARAGRDEMPHLNVALDRFVTASLAVDLPLTLVNHPRGPHAFDIVDDGPASRDVVRQILTFIGHHLKESVESA